MSVAESKEDDRTQLVMRMERPATPRVAHDTSEPRTAMFRNPDLILDAAEVEAVQMSALLGGALSAHRSLPPAPPRVRSPIPWGLWLRRLLVVSVLGTFFLAIVALAMTGVEERARTESRAEARLLQELLLTGSLSEAALHLAKLEALLLEAKTPRSLASLRARAEATLYRLHDADPSRRRRASKLLALEASKRSSDGWVAELLLASADERGKLLTEGESLALPGDAYPVAFRAAIEAARGRVAEARAAYERAETMEPSHVIHLYGLHALEEQNARPKEATMVLERMEDVSPSSPWTKLAIARAEVEPETRASALLALAENASLPAIPRALAVESALFDGELALDPEQRSHYEDLLGELTHGDESLLRDIPLPPRPRRGPHPVDAATNTTAAPTTIVTPELTIELAPEPKPSKAKKKTRRKKRAR